MSLELDDDARIISYEEYSPYGSTTYQAMNEQIKAARKRYRFTGKERDEETGLNYHSARYYAPWLGRWASTDPAGLVDGVNLYGYSQTNPILYSDPSGTQVKEPTTVDELKYTTKEGTYMGLSREAWMKYVGMSIIERAHARRIPFRKILLIIAHARGEQALRDPRKYKFRIFNIQATKEEVKEWKKKTPDKRERGLSYIPSPEELEGKKEIKTSPFWTYTGIRQSIDHYLDTIGLGTEEGRFKSVGNLLRRKGNVSASEYGKMLKSSGYMTESGAAERIKRTHREVTAEVKNFRIAESYLSYLKVQEAELTERIENLSEREKVLYEEIRWRIGDVTSFLSKKKSVPAK